jgi:hypothetical protein
MAGTGRSRAGWDLIGKPIEKFDGNSHKIYDSKKEAFVLGENIVRE